MPRTTREYLLRYADQADNDLERALDRLKLISDTYGGIVPIPQEDGDTVPPVDEMDYRGNHARYQKYVDLIAAQLMQVKEELLVFRKRFM